MRTAFLRSAGVRPTDPRSGSTGVRPTDPRSRIEVRCRKILAKETGREKTRCFPSAMQNANADEEAEGHLSPSLSPISWRRGGQSRRVIDWFRESRIKLQKANDSEVIQVNPSKSNQLIYDMRLTIYERWERAAVVAGSNDLMRTTFLQVTDLRSGSTGVRLNNLRPGIAVPNGWRNSTLPEEKGVFTFASAIFLT